MRSPKNLKIMLGFSLALNILVVTAVAGFIFAGHYHGGPRKGDGLVIAADTAEVRNVIRRLARGLQNEDRQALRRTLQIAYVKAGLTRAQHTELQQALYEQLSATAFDPQTAQTALKALFDFNAARADIMHQTIISYLSDLPPQMRQELLKPRRSKDKGHK